MAHLPQQLHASKSHIVAAPLISWDSVASSATLEDMLRREYGDDFNAADLYGDEDPQDDESLAEIMAGFGLGDANLRSIHMLETSEEPTTASQTAAGASIHTHLLPSTPELHLPLDLASGSPTHTHQRAVPECLQQSSALQPPPLTQLQPPLAQLCHMIPDSAPYHFFTPASERLSPCPQLLINSLAWPSVLHEQQQTPAPHRHPFTTSGQPQQTASMAGPNFLQPVVDSCKAPTLISTTMNPALQIGYVFGTSTQGGLPSEKPPDTAPFVEQLDVQAWESLSLDLQPCRVEAEDCDEPFEQTTRTRMQARSLAVQVEAARRARRNRLMAAQTAPPQVREEEQSVEESGSMQPKWRPDMADLMPLRTQSVVVQAPLGSPQQPLSGGMQAPLVSAHQLSDSQHQPLTTQQLSPSILELPPSQEQAGSESPDGFGTIEDLLRDWGGEDADLCGDDEDDGAVDEQGISSETLAEHHELDLEYEEPDVLMRSPSPHVASENTAAAMAAVDEVVDAPATTIAFVRSPSAQRVADRVVLHARRSRLSADAGSAT